MLVLVTVMSCPCYLNNFPLELTRCCEANFGFETLTKPQGEGSAAWAVALQLNEQKLSLVYVEITLAVEPFHCSIAHLCCAF